MKQSFKVRFPALSVFFPRTDDSHCDRIRSSLTAVHCFDNGHVGKLPELEKNIVRSTCLKNSKKA